VACRDFIGRQEKGREGLAEAQESGGERRVTKSWRSSQNMESEVRWDARMRASAGEGEEEI
jgi:hypothetical protein